MGGHSLHEFVIHRRRIKKRRTPRSVLPLWVEIDSLRFLGDVSGLDSLLHYAAIRTKGSFGLIGAVLRVGSFYGGGAIGGPGSFGTYGAFPLRGSFDDYGSVARNGSF